MRSAAETTARGWRLAMAALLVHVLAAGLFRVHNLDIGLHAATGEWILEHGEVPATNVLSDLHHDHPSVHDKWGFQVLAHLLADGLGPNALIGARVLLLVALAGLLLGTARGLGAAPGPALLVVSLALLACRNRFLFRPGLVSLVLLAALLRWAWVSEREGRRGWVPVLLVVVWVNLHGYFVLGPLTVGALALGHGLRGRDGWPVARRWALTAVAMVVAGLLNPSGLDGLLHPVTILADLSAHGDFYRGAIEEFTPTFSGEAPWTSFRIAYLVMLVALVALAVWELILRRGGRGAGAARDAHGATRVPRIGEPPEGTTAAEGADPALPAVVGSRASAVAAEDMHARSGGAGAEPPPAAPGWPHWVPLVMFAVMSLSLRRNIVLFAVAAAPLLAVLWTRRLGRWWPRPWAAAGCVLVLALAEGSDALSIADGHPRRTGLGWSRIAYPDHGIAFVAEHLPEANVFTAFRYGSTFTGRRRPHQRAATNGNTHGYPTAYLQQVMAATADSDPQAFGRLVLRHGHEAALLPMAAPLAGRLLRDPAWTLVCVGRHEALFVRGDRVDPAWLEAHDLEARLAAGEGLALPVDEIEDPRPAWKARPEPATTLAAAAMLMAGGHADAAYTLVERALEFAPRHGTALALGGLMAVRRERPDVGLRRLRLALQVGCPPGLEADVRAALAEAEAEAGGGLPGD